MTGGAGFIGHHLVEHILKTTDWEVVTLDRLDTSGNLNRLTDLSCWKYEKKRVRVIFHDLRADISTQLRAQIGNIDHIFHLAAATHVDRSISDPFSFVMDNVVGTCNILNYARVEMIPFFLFSTDEVFGPAPKGVLYTEWSRYKSGNPYSATKAGAEELTLSFFNTYGLPVMISHCMNVFVERQHPEKFIPMSIRRIRDGEAVTIHSDATKTVSGSRFYIHARNVAAAVLFLVKNGEPGEKYNIVGEKEVSNLEMASAIAKIQERPLLYEMVDFHSSRPGHDLRYGLNGEKLKNLGFVPSVSFEKSLEKTVTWSLKNERWLNG